MGWNVRDITARVATCRLDVPDAFAPYLAQRAIQEVCRRTLLDRETKSFTLEADATSFAVTTSVNKGLVKVLRAFWTETGASYQIEEATQYFLSTRAQVSLGTPRWWTMDGAIFYLWPGQHNGGDCTLEMATYPTEDQAVCTLPEYTVPAVEAITRADLFMMPGAGRDLQAAAACRSMAEDIIAKFGLATSAYNDPPRQGAVGVVPAIGR